MGITTRNDTLKYILENGNIDIARKAVEKGCIVDPSALSYALGKNDMESARWLVSINCGWNNNTLTIALGLSIETAEWLLSEGCTFFNSSPCYQASMDGDMDKLEWLYKNECPLEMIGACHSGNLEIMEWLDCRSATFDRQVFVDGEYMIKDSGAAFEKALMYGDLFNLKWMVDNGCEITPREFHVGHKDQNTFSWLTASLFFMENLVSSECSYPHSIIEHGFIYLVKVEVLEEEGISVDFESCETEILCWLRSIGWTIYCTGMLDISDW